ncbi:glycosyltransferase [Microbulbifer hydrolyticus]|uniref:Glycosyltransferase n=1 Tax=Microbulbifer hydrolyticus TaxID=48074 RepID=A0A6P1TAA3_9GAMM|nr:glycosyltransferase [Microbulbifer hydrolyticus]MBB5210597.1 glycosyltransferase involved in cell wall biosynthesis [Microbulbifer hydrolyticus]QHQ38937.1 glycosyltransferase [Microbulbifer hydrolyticus]
MIRKVLQRGWQYYKLYGAHRFLWAISFKLRQKAKQLTDRHLKFGSFLAGAGYHKAFTLFPAQERVEKPSRPPKKLFRTPLVVLIADLNLPQCRKYRVVQKMEALEQMGVHANYAHWEDVPRSMNMLQMATFVIFYRVQDGALLDSYLRECDRLSIPTAYDIDDPIFSKRIYQENRNLDYLSSHEKDVLLESTELYRKALVKCDVAILSTPKLAEEVRTLSTKQAVIWRNAIDQETIAAARQGLERANTEGSHIPNGKISIVYASGSRAHEADFRTVESTLFKVLKEHPEAHLSIIGHLILPDSFGELEDRITETGFSDYSQYIKTLARADINIVPLVIDDFNDCKSAIRFMEASLAGIPTVASSVGDFCNVIKDGENGYLATDSDEWYRKIKLLLNSSDLREKLGKNAQQSVSETLGTREITGSLPEAIKDMIYGRRC